VCVSAVPIYDARLGSALSVHAYVVQGKNYRHLSNAAEKNRTICNRYLVIVNIVLNMKVLLLAKNVFCIWGKCNL